MRVNPNIFFIIKDGQMVVWDYDNHQQFELEPSYVDRLLFWAKNPPSLEELTPIDQELLEGKLLLTTEEDTCLSKDSKEWGWDALSHIFHKGTSDICEKTLTQDEWNEQYVTYCQEIAQTPPLERPSKGTLPLPAPNEKSLENATLLKTLYDRKTCRSFYGETLSLENLSTLLYFSFGVIHKEWPDLKGLKQLGIRKAFPAGGGLHAEEVYMIVYRVDGLAPGIYHYDSQAHLLSLVSEGFFEKNVIELLSSQYFCEGLSVGFFITSRFEQYWWKYPHSRAYRPALLDIGHASQTFLLTATALGLQTWLTAAFQDTSVRDFLKLDNKTEHPLFFVGAGYGSNESIPPSIRSYLDKTKP